MSMSGKQGVIWGYGLYSRLYYECKHYRGEGVPFCHENRESVVDSDNSFH